MFKTINSSILSPGPIDYLQLNNIFLLPFS